MQIVEQIPVIDLGQRILDKPTHTLGQAAKILNGLRNGGLSEGEVEGLVSESNPSGPSGPSGPSPLIAFPPQSNLLVPTPRRTPGLHVSGLIRSAALKYGLLKPRTRQQQVAQDKEQEVLRSFSTFSSFGGGGTGLTFEEDCPLIVFMGLCWEDRLQQQYPNMVYHIGEFDRDGVLMSPDGIEEWNGVWFVDEIKLTYKSMSTPFEFQTLYHIQTKAYCKRLKTNYCRFHVLYVNGNYTDTRGPHYRLYDITYTDLELQSNWDFLLRHRDWLASTGGLDEIIEKAA